MVGMVWVFTSTSRKIRNACEWLPATYLPRFGVDPVSRRDCILPYQNVEFALPVIHRCKRTSGPICLSVGESMCTTHRVTE